jgi:hypothetical protein
MRELYERTLDKMVDVFVENGYIYLNIEEAGFSETLIPTY